MMNNRNPMTIGDVGELFTLGAGMLGGVSTLIVGGLTLAGFLMKHADPESGKRKQQRQRQEMDAELAYLVRQEVKRQRQIETQYYNNGNRNTKQY